MDLNYCNTSSVVGVSGLEGRFVLLVAFTHNNVSDRTSWYGRISIKFIAHVTARLPERIVLCVCVEEEFNAVSHLNVYCRLHYIEINQS